MRSLIIAFVLSLSLLSVFPAHAATLTDVSQNKVEFSFPETATFQLTASGSAEITSVVLEYGDKQQTCGEVIAKAFPQFTPGTSVQTEWTWDMRQFGSLPPGTQIWWQWRIKDANGNETLTEKKTVTWLDSVHPWQTIASGQLNLHYYDLDRSFAQEMLNAGVEGMNRNKNEAGLTTDSPVDIYVYPNYDDLREAVLYEHSWTGGQAYPEENIVIMGISGGNASWDKATVIHELTHVLVGHFTFSCLGDVPQWLEEGLAVYSEGPLDPQFKGPLDQAIQSNQLLTIRSISGSFSEVSDKADLSYAESYSIVNYLIQTYGQDKMTALLAAFREGATTDEALQQTYGFNIDGLEDQWRKSIGAQPRTESAPTAQPTPTFVPTIVPISGGSLILQVTATPVPTSSFNGQSPAAPPPSSSGPPLALTLILLALCCAILLVLGVAVLAIVLSRQNKKGGTNAR